ncbi:MAG: hypothetical protein U0931_35065 [Vulcanimicrobiota bacterium]
MKRWLLFWTLSNLAWADPTLIKIVTSNTSPGIKADSFAARPRTVYRLGSSLARVEEVDDPVDKVHMVVIRAHSQGWTLDLRNKVGRHSQGLPDKVRVPLLPLGGLADLEFGHELEFMQKNKIEPKDGAYTFSFEDYVIKLSVSEGKPQQLEASQKGKLLMRLHYDEYLTGLPEDPDLFVVPKDIKLTD